MANIKKLLTYFYRAAVSNAVLPIAMVSVRLSVRLSVCLSVRHSENCDKTKAPSEKSSIMTNRKSPTTLPMSLR